MSGQAILALIDGGLTIFAVAIGLVIVMVILRQTSVRLAAVVDALNELPEQSAEARATLARAEMRLDRLRESLAEPGGGAAAAGRPGG